MLTYNQLIELRDKLTNDEIGLELAKEQCWKDFKQGQRSWHTKDWKDRKSKFIQEKCELAVFYFGLVDPVCVQKNGVERGFILIIDSIYQGSLPNQGEASRLAD